MQKSTQKALLAMIACGMAGTAASAAPHLINISGATLLRDLIIAPAISNDYIDVDGDGIASPSLDQLAPTGITLTNPNQRWQIQYRGVGSVNGVIELQMWGPSYALLPGDILVSAAAENAWHNRTLYINQVGGVATPVGDANAANPGAAPRRSRIDGTFLVSTSTSGVDAGVLVDIAPVDVPILWATQGAAGGASNKVKPGAPGYGQNPALAVDKNGTLTTTANTLPPLAPLNTNFAAPDDHTVYDTNLAIAPIAVLTNIGTGLKTITYSDLKWLNTTGRTKKGENYILVTRDVGSGTRNGFCNSIGNDPSWGVGENTGPLTSSSANDLVGPNFTPSNKGGSSRMEGTLQNARLGLGYSGAERQQTPLTNGVYEVLGVRNDIAGGAAFARPSINNILDNDVNGYNINGPAIFATIGDPRAEAVARGGDANGNPMMANPEAAAFVNNLTRSLAAFKALPGGDETTFSPGEFLAARFVPRSAPDNLSNRDIPTTLDPNPTFNATLQTFIRNNSVLRLAPFVTFNMTTQGAVPGRTNLTLPNVYTDGVSNQGRFVAQDGTFFNYGQPMATFDAGGRNKLCGDMNADGLRNWNDIAELVAAWKFRNGQAASWQPATKAVIELLADFNADGNFNAADVRYFADGLAVNPATGELDRSEGFLRVDQAFAGNFFGTTLATGAAYTAGASAADVSNAAVTAGASFVTKGFQPSGADGVIDANDLTYISRNFGAWANQDDAEVIDLSADVNGDLVVDINDVCRTLSFLGTIFGDVNLDGVVDGADLSTAQANVGNPGGWAQGDVDCDGTVTSADIAIIAAGGANLCCPADLNGDGFVNSADLAALLGAWGPGAGPADLNNDGFVNSADLAALLGGWGPCN